VVLHSLRTPLRAAVAEALSVGWVFEELEPRLLFSASFDAVLIDGALDDQELLLSAAEGADLIHVYDSRYQSADEVLAEVVSWADGHNQQLDSLSILSHGRDGAFELGDEKQTTASLNQSQDNQNSWQSLARVLDSDADIYLYGCNLAASADGEALLESLAGLTGANVHASDDLTGSGGDWVLEVSTASANGMTPLNVELLQHYHYSLGNETVADQFINAAFDGDDGTISWTSDWAEGGESDGVSAGFIRVGDQNGAMTGNELTVGGDGLANGYSITRGLDLSLASSAQLNFDYQREVLSAGGTINLEIYNGTNWSVLQAFTLSSSDGSVQSFSTDITASIDADTQLRFCGVGMIDGFLHVDNLQIDYVVPNYAPVLDNSSDLSLNSSIEDDLVPAGSSVVTILASAGGTPLTDLNVSDSLGIAVIGVDDSNGTWQYDALANGSWQDFGAVSDNSAVLLDSSALIRFVPNANFSGDAGDITFRGWDQTSGNNGDTAVDVSVNGNQTAFSSQTETASQMITAVGDTPVAANITTLEDTQSGLIVLDRHAADGAEVTHFRISGISGGTLYLADGVTQVNDGDYISYAAGQAGLRFTPDVNSNSAGSFNVQSSEDGSSVAAQSGTTSSTITVTPVGDTPVAANITTLEDTQSGLIVLDRHAADGAEVTHFRISGISGGTLYLADGVTQVNDGDYISYAAGQAGLRFTPDANSNSAGSFNVQSSEDGSSVAAQSGTTSSTITVTPVGDTPVAANITILEDTQSGLIVLDRHAADGAEVTHFRISDISGGALFLADGVTQVNDGDYISYAAGQAGLRFTPDVNSNSAGSFNVQSSEDGSSVAAQSGITSSTITVTPVGDTPVAANITTLEDTQSGLIILDRHTDDGAEVTHFRISGISGGTLYLADGVTQVNDGDYISYAAGQAGLRFTPDANSNSAGGFNVQSSEDGSSVAAQSGTTSSTITVTPVGDTPVAANITTLEDTQSGLIVLDRHTDDGAEVTHFRISGISGGTLYLADGVTQVNDGDYISYAAGQAGLRFTPDANSNSAGSFNVQSSEDGSSVAAQSGITSSTITVTPVGDTPVAANITTLEDTQSGLIVLDRHAADGAEVTHFRISGISGGTLYLADGVTQVNDGDYISYAAGQAGLRFTPDANSNSAGSFSVQSSEDGSSVSAQSGTASSTITVTPVGDAPVVASITTTEDTQSGLITIGRNAVDGNEVSHYRISGISGGALYLANGSTQVNDGDYISFGAGQAGLRFTPDAHSNQVGAFDVTASTTGNSVFAQSGTDSSTVTITPVGDTPQSLSATTSPDTQSGLIVINRHQSDGSEVSHFRISGISGGTLFLSDGLTQVNDGDFISYAQAQSGLRFTPDSLSGGQFSVESSENGTSVAAQSGAGIVSIAVVEPVEEEELVVQGDEPEEIAELEVVDAPALQSFVEDVAEDEGDEALTEEPVVAQDAETELLEEGLFGADEAAAEAEEILPAAQAQALVDVLNPPPIGGSVGIQSFVAEFESDQSKGNGFQMVSGSQTTSFQFSELSLSSLENVLPDTQQKLFSMWLQEGVDDRRELELLDRDAEYLLEVSSKGVLMTAVAGAVSWSLRAGSLLSGFLTVMPAWRGFDPLPVLSPDAIDHLAELTEEPPKDQVEQIFDAHDSDEDRE